MSDAMLLAACHELDAAVTVLVAGPGLDGELSREQVEIYLHAHHASRVLALSEQQTNLALRVLEWHPSEATALLVAASRGLEGMAEIRGGGLRVRLGPESASVWALDAETVTSLPLPASVLGSGSLDEVEKRLRQLLGWSELDLERDKAASLRQMATVSRSRTHE